MAANAAAAPVASRLEALPPPSALLLPCCRPAAEYDASHITKPARRSVSVPLGEGGDAFVARAAACIPNQAAQIIVVSVGWGTLLICLLQNSSQ